MPISVIVSNFNGLKYLPRLIETLQAQRNVSTEIIIVDRESSDGSLEYLSHFPEIRVISEPAITGLVTGYAAGARIARHDLLFFCNEDMWFDPNCLELLEKHIDPAAGIVASDPWQWTYDGKSWIHGGVRFFRCGWDPNSPYPRRGVDFNVNLAAGERVPFPCAGAFLMDRRAYEDAGGWDSSFFLDHEDIDLFLRVWQRGLYCVTVPEAKVYHAVNASNTKVLANSQVLPRRYIANRSNLAVIGLKYYSGASWLLSWCSLLIPLASDIVKLRFRKFSLDAQSVALTFRRIGAVRSFRRCNREWIKSKPGYQFFLQKDMTLP